MLFSEFVEINPRVPIERDGVYPCVMMDEVKPGRKSVSGKISKTFRGGAKFAKNDTLFARITPCLENGKIAKYTGQNGKYGFGSTEFFVFREKENVSDSDYLFYFSLSDIIRKPAEASMFGASGRQRADLDVVKNIEFDFPPLPIQRKIAGVLSTYDDLIENNTRRIAILEEMAQRIYKEWFVDFKYPGHENDKMVDSELGMIPEEWEVASLDHICERITDGAHRSPESTDYGYPMASVKDMHPWGINIETCRKISEHDFRQLQDSDCIMVKNDVLIAKDGSYLKHCFVVEEDMDIALLSSIAILRPNKKINPHILALTMKQPEIKARMAGYVSGAALPRIILKDFKKFKIKLPKKEIQVSWENCVGPIIKSCYRIIDINTNLRQTRDLLLPKLISGKVDVSELDIDVVAEA